VTVEKMDGWPGFLYFCFPLPIVPNSSKNIHPHLQSGILDEYCLGLLPEGEEKKLEEEIARSPELQKRLAEVRKIFASDASGKPANSVWEKIRSTIASGNPSSPPSSNLLLSAHTNVRELREQIQSLVLPDSEDDITMVPFRKVHDFEQWLVRVHREVPEEIHTDLLESFLILEGSCTCHLGETKIDLTAGGFLEIPFHVPHSVTVTSEKPVLAILQRGKIY
jgi:mannose-6-phosphate isomerase-like protein (cupin superfamily)